MGVGHWLVAVTSTKSWRLLVVLPAVLVDIGSTWHWMRGWAILVGLGFETGRACTQGWHIGRGSRMPADLLWRPVSAVPPHNTHLEQCKMLLKEKQANLGLSLCFNHPVPLAQSKACRCWFRRNACTCYRPRCVPHPLRFPSMRFSMTKAQHTSPQANPHRPQGTHGLARVCTHESLSTS